MVDDSEREIQLMKSEYNKINQRIKKGGTYLDNEDVPLEEREKFIPAYCKIILEQNNVLHRLKNAGVEVTDEQYFNGFEGEEREL